MAQTPRRRASKTEDDSPSVPRAQHTNIQTAAESPEEPHWSDRPVAEWSDEEVLEAFRDNSSVLNQIRREVAGGIRNILGTDLQATMELRRVEFQVAENLLQKVRSLL